MAAPDGVHQSDEEHEVDADEERQATAAHSGRGQGGSGGVFEPGRGVFALRSNWFAGGGLF